MDRGADAGLTVMCQGDNTVLEANYNFIKYKSALSGRQPELVGAEFERNGMKADEIVAMNKSREPWSTGIATMGEGESRLRLLSSLSIAVARNRQGTSSTK